MQDHSVFLSLIFLVLVLFLSHFASANDVLGFSPSSKLPKLQAEKLIRELNLLPKDAEPVDAVDREIESPKRLVEAPVRFPGVDYADDSITVEDLGHHAGYYKIKKSRAARSVF